MFIVIYEKMRKIFFFFILKYEQCSYICLVVKNRIRQMYKNYHNNLIDI